MRVPANPVPVRRCVNGTCPLPRPCTCKPRPAIRAGATPAPRPRPRPGAPRRPAPPAHRPAPSPLHNTLPNKKLRGVARWEAEVLALVNSSRAAHGVPPVRTDPTLRVVAKKHNADQAFLAQCITHVGTDGAHIGERLRRAGYIFRYAAENVAAGQKTPRHVHRSLMRSPGHRKNVLSPFVDEMGLHVGRGPDGRLYWTQVFGRRK